MNNIELLTKLNTLRDVEIALKEAQLEDIIIPEAVFSILKDIEQGYRDDKEAMKEEETALQRQYDEDMEHEKDLIDLQEYEANV